MRPLAFIFAGLLGLVGAAPSAGADWTVEAIPVQHRFASEIAETIRLALTPEGRLTVHESTNQLVIRDTPAGIAAAKALLAQLDTAPRTVVLSLTTTDRETLEARSAEIDWGVRSGGIAVGNRLPREDGVFLGATLRAEDGERLGEARQTLKVLSGKEGRLFSGSTRPVQLSRGRYDRDVVYQSAGDDLYVRPVALPDGKVRVEISTRSTEAVGRRGAITEGSSASTIVVVPDGGSVVIGDVARDGSGSSMRWLGGASTEATSASTVFLLHVSLQKEAP